jgi:osmotically-inducible protein OsmY
MKRFSMLLAFSLCLAAEPLGTGGIGGKGFDDPLIHARVKAALDDPDDAVIHIEVLHGVVQLTGIVGNEPERQEAGRVAMGVTGVRDVRNHLVIGPALLQSGETPEDRQVVSRIKSRLGANEDIDSFDIHVEVRQGVALLGGFVRTNHERKAAVRAARAAQGVRDVINRIDLIRVT